MFFNQMMQDQVNEIKKLRAQLAAARSKNKRLKKKNQRLYAMYDAAQQGYLGKDNTDFTRVCWLTLPLLQLNRQCNHTEA